MSKFAHNTHDGYPRFYVNLTENRFWNRNVCFHFINRWHPVAYSTYFFNRFPDIYYANWPSLQSIRLQFMTKIAYISMPLLLIDLACPAPQESQVWGNIPTTWQNRGVKPTRTGVLPQQEVVGVLPRGYIFLINKLTNVGTSQGNDEMKSTWN